MTHIEAVRRHTEMSEVMADHDAMPDSNIPREDQWFSDAKSYVWGREDAGDAKIDESWGFTFAAAWLDAQRNYRDGKRSMLPNLRDAYEAFRDGKPF